MIRAALVRVETLSDSISSFYWQPESPVHFIAGQYGDFVLPHANADERGSRRWFTISSSPTQPLLRTTIRRKLNGGSSFKQTLWQLKAGDSIQLTDSQGDFVLPLSADRSLVMAAIGIGITPFMSMLDWLDAPPNRKEHHNIHLVHAINSSLETTELFVPSLSVPFTIIQNKLTTDQLLAAASTPETLFYLSGPEAVVQLLAKDLAKRGIERYNIITDAFLGY